jgi:predicted dehydrogenase
VIGCGRIGSLWDEGQPAGPARTHAGAWQRSGRVVLAALCDQDPARLAEAGARRRVQALYADYRAMLRQETPDLLSLCTTPDQRLGPITAALEAGARLILCEKPLARDLATAREIARRVQAARARLAVAHLRRWAPGIRAAAALVQQGRLGSPQWAVGHYDKGLNNNGSHLIDLLALLLGRPRRLVPLFGGREPGPGGDPTGDLLLLYPDFPAYLLGADHRALSLFELDILGTAGRLTLSDKGNRIQLQVAGDDPLRPGYRCLHPEQSIPGRVAESWAYLVDELLEIQAGRRQDPACGIPEALGVMEVLEAARLAWARNGPVDIDEVLP